MPDAATTLTTLFDRFGVLFAVAIATFATVEVALAARRAFADVDPKEVVSNLASHGIGTGLRALTRFLRAGAFALASSLAPAHPPTTWPSVVAAYFAVDLTLYVWHRVLHETELGWAFHSVHHSSARYDLSLGARASWIQRIADDLVYLPIALAGFDPAVLFVLIDLNRLSQLWTHSPSIGPLGLLDRFLDTPSNHRVHHRCDGPGRTWNYGSNFVIWDRLFGTYRAEGAREPYGRPFGELGANPFRIQLAGLRWWLAKRRTR